MAGKTNASVSAPQKPQGRNSRATLPASRTSLESGKPQPVQRMATQLLSGPNNASSRYVIVECAFLGIETSHDIADHQSDTAKNLGEVAADSPAPGNPPAIRRNHFQFEDHFAGSGAVLH